MIVLNANAPTEDNIDDVKHIFCEESEHAFNDFPEYHIKTLLGDLNAEVGREVIFKPTNGNESLHEISDTNAVNFCWK
jgi:hypothetical protein